MESSQVKPELESLIGRLSKEVAGRLTAVLTRIFGIEHLSLAEDAVQDVLVKAWETWHRDGIPDNPEAWLFRAAKNRAIDVVRKNKRNPEFSTDLAPLLDSAYTTHITLEDCFSENAIQDDQLRMMFACCHPDIANAGQIALILKTLCGFTVAQIAKAYITSADTIEKRLYRARQVFRQKKIPLELPEGEALHGRMQNVLQAIYLLFNEAYSASYHNTLIRAELAADAIHLCTLLLSYPPADTPQANALLALLYFHAARLDARTDTDGNLILMKDQNRSLWDKEAIATGKFYLNRAAAGDTLSNYHLEAAIAYEHCKALHYHDTNWQHIADLYSILLKMSPSPIVALNRAVAIKELQGAAQGIECIRQIPGIDFLQKYYLLHGILAEWYAELGKTDIARRHYELALQYVPSDAEKKFIAGKLRLLPD